MKLQTDLIICDLVTIGHRGKTFIFCLNLSIDAELHLLDQWSPFEVWVESWTVQFLSSGDSLDTVVLGTLTTLVG